MKFYPFFCQAFMITFLFSCDGSQQNGGKDRNDQAKIPANLCSTISKSSNECLNLQKQNLTDTGNPESIAVEMVAVTLKCKPTPKEFEEFLCLFNK